MPNAQRYKFIRGTGNAAHETLLNEAAADGYKATLMTFDRNGIANNEQVIVLVELEK